MSARRKTKRLVCGLTLSLAPAIMMIGCSGRQPVRASTPATAPSYPTRASGSSRTEERSGEDVERAAEAKEMPKIPADGHLLGTEEGLASWYGTVYDRRRAADGTVYDQNAMTAASRTLPLGVLAQVTNLADGQTAVVKITDRGPFVPRRIIDLSHAAAKAIGLDRIGVGKVRVEAYAGEGYKEVPAKWCVQIGAFADADDARQMQNDLLRHYPTAKVIAFDGPTGSWVRLTLTSADREESAGVAAMVRVPDPGVEAYVTRTN